MWDLASKTQSIDVFIAFIVFSIKIESREWLSMDFEKMDFLALWVAGKHLKNISEINVKMANKVIKIFKRSKYFVKCMFSGSKFDEKHDFNIKSWRWILFCG